MSALAQDKTWEPRIFAGTSFAIDEVCQATAFTPSQHDRLFTAVRNLNDAFKSRQMVEIKLACEAVAAAAADVERTAMQIKALAASVGSTFTTHLARRPRV